MRADKYRNFAELAAAEDAANYRIVAVNRGTAHVLLAGNLRDCSRHRRR